MPRQLLRFSGIVVTSIVSACAVPKAEQPRSGELDPAVIAPAKQGENTTDSSVRKENRRSAVEQASLRDSDEFTIKQACAENVHVKKDFGPESVRYAQPLNEKTMVAMDTGGKVYSSFDAGKSWVATLTEPTAEWLVVDSQKRAWATDGMVAWFSDDGKHWLPLSLNRSEESRYDGWVIRNGQAWLTEGRHGDLIEPRTDLPISEWQQLKVKGGFRYVASVRSQFAVINWERQFFNFDEKGAGTQEAVSGNYAYLACEQRSCLVVDSDVYWKGLSGSLRSVGNVFALGRWYVEHCPMSDRLAGLKKAILNAERAPCFSISEVAFDGDTVAITSTISLDCGEGYVMSLLAGKRGISVLDVGGNGVWSPAPGEFWFMGERITPVVTRGP